MTEQIHATLRPQGGSSRNEGITSQDIAEMKMEDLIDCREEESTIDKITQLQEIIDTYSLSFATEKKINEAIKILNGQIMREKVPAEMSGLLTKSNIIKEIKKSLVFKKI